MMAKEGGLGGGIKLNKSNPEVFAVTELHAWILAQQLEPGPSDLLKVTMKI